MGKAKVAGGPKGGKGAGPSDDVPGSGKKRNAANANKKKNQKKKKKEKMECGESGEYGDLQKKTGLGQFDRDHVPSKAALKEYARKTLRGGSELCGDQKTAIDKVGAAIAIPKWLHQQYSRTYGGLNSEANIGTDSENLQKAAKRDVAAIKKGLKGKKMSPECKKKYKAWADKVSGTTKRQYDALLSKAIGK